MIRLRISGSQAFDCLQRLTTNDLSGLKIGTLKYALICRENGDLIDSVSIVKFSEKEFMMIADSSEVEDHLPQAAENFRVSINDISRESFMLALQGPKSVEIMGEVLGFDCSLLGRREVSPFNLKDRRGWVQRFGFTGESGFELLVEPKDAVWFWDRILEAGAAPCAYLASEDLRIAAGFVSLDKESGNPFENRLGSMVDFRKGPFVGRPALLEALKSGMRKVLVWLLAEEEGTASAVGEKMRGRVKSRPGLLPSGTPEAAAHCPGWGMVEIQGENIGRVSSSGIFWDKKRLLVMAYVKPEHVVEGVECQISFEDGKNITTRLTNQPPRVIKLA